jgi:CRISPR/Cas system CSM-associated protein Csm4 (group 5 of RAMP superfamily)
MRVLEVEEMELFSKIDLRDVSWWMSIKDTYRLRVPVIATLSKKGNISQKKGTFP